MVKQYATIGFICVVAVVAVVVGTRTTTISGRVMEANLYDQVKEQEPALERIACDDEIPIQRWGAKFVCTLHAPGDAVEVEYQMARDGSMRSRPRVSRNRRP